VAKDRAAPFSRKHRRYWLPVTGGMILIGAINVGLGFCAYDGPAPPPEKIEPVLPHSTYSKDAGIDAPAPAPDAPPPDAPPLAAPAPPPAPAPPTAR
jgi:hypothetical protein